MTQRNTGIKLNLLADGLFDNDPYASFNLFIEPFRYIELSNGLRALLISDQSQEACVCKSDQSDDDGDDNEKEDDTEGEEEDSVSEEESNVDRHSNDSNGEVRKKIKKVTLEKQVISLKLLFNWSADF